MKRKELIRELEKAGFVLYWHGAKHDIDQSAKVKAAYYIIKH